MARPLSRGPWSKVMGTIVWRCLWRWRRSQPMAPQPSKTSIASRHPSPAFGRCWSQSGYDPFDSRIALAQGHGERSRTMNFREVNPVFSPFLYAVGKFVQSTALNVLWRRRIYGLEHVPPFGTPAI